MEPKQNINEKKYDLLLNEYNMLQNKIEHYDNLIFIIKGWSISLLSGLIAFTDEYIALVVTGLLCIVGFLVLELLTKQAQTKFICRFNKLEHNLRAGKWYTNDNLIEIKGVVPDIFGSHSVKNLDSKIKYSRLIRSPYLFLTHMMELIVLVSVASMKYLGYF